MALGVVGALVARYLGRALGLYATGQSAGLMMSILGAMLLLLLYRFFPPAREPERTKIRRNHKSNGPIISVSSFMLKR